MPDAEVPDPGDVAPPDPDAAPADIVAPTDEETSDADTEDVDPSDVPLPDVPPTDVEFPDLIIPDVPPTDVEPPDVPLTDVPPTDAEPPDVPLTDVEPPDVPLTDVEPPDVPLTDVDPPDVPPTDVPDSGPTDAGDTDATDTGGCTTDSDCDDGFPCTGTETCVAGACVNGTPPDCDDGLDCTNDSCTPATGLCAHNPDLDACVCNAVSMTHTMSFDTDKISKTVPCPIVGGITGFESAFTINGSYTAGNCGNKCATNLSLGGSFTETTHACGTSLGMSGGVTYSGTKTGCLTCNATTCEQGCSAGTCDRHTISGNASTKFTKFYGYHQKGDSLGVGMEVKCGATFSATYGAGGSVTTTKDNGYTCADCVECTSVTANGGAGVGGALDCFIDIDFFKKAKYSVGVKNAGALNIGMYAGGGGQSGKECKDTRCLFAGATVNASANSPCVGVSVGFFGVSAKCSASASACREANSCTCTAQCPKCSSASTQLSCTVAYNGSCK